MTLSTNDFDVRSLWQVVAICVMVLAWGSGTSGFAQTPSTTIENGNGDLRFQLNYDGGLYVPGTYGPASPADSIPATGEGTRMMWYPAKASFRGGRLIHKPGGWDPKNIGTYSFAFGLDSEAKGRGAVAMGEYVYAGGEHSVALGHQTEANEFRSVAMGSGTRTFGVIATAMGFATNARGQASTAMGQGTTAIGLASTAMGENTTANSDHSLSIGKYNDVNTSNSGDTDILLVAGNGEQLNRSDALVLDKDGNLSISGVFESDPTGNTYAGHFRGNKNQTDAGGPDSHVAFVENTNTGFSASGLAIQTGGSDPGPVGGNNFLTFYGGGGDPVGAVDGNGSGGVNFESGGADYAEELPVAEGTPTPEPTELVGVRAGTVRRATDDANQVLIASRAPAVTGNATPSNTEDDAGRVAVAFMGQVPVKVRGTAQIGDLIVASGQNDGTARAVAPSQYRHAEHGPVQGRPGRPRMPKRSAP